jgi:DNA-binding LacI/PurR family transcriptional regulator
MSDKHAAAKRSPVTDQVVAEIKKRIVAGVYKPHSYLPSERLLSQELQTSRRSVSLGLARLQTEGLVVQTPGRGTRLLPPPDRRQQVVIGVAYLAGFSTLPLQLTHILRGIEEIFGSRGYPYKLMPLDHAKQEGVVQEIMRNCGALLCLHTFDYEKEIFELERERFPVVVAGLEVKGDVSGTWVDHRKTTMAAVKVLTGMGHRRIAFLGLPPTKYFYSDAREGYRAGLAEAGIPVDESLIATVDGGCDPLSAYIAARPLLSLPQRPTAIVTGRDLEANGACRAIQETGLIVGRDISVFGFDDNSWPGSESLLTTFREPCEELGNVAAEMLVARILYGWHPPERRELEAPMIFRQSVGPVFEKIAASHV